jgi:hypothetical protein
MTFPTMIRVKKSHYPMATENAVADRLSQGFMNLITTSENTLPLSRKVI